MSAKQTGPPAPAPKSMRMSTGRLEAFSDGVMAVAITLLVLNITVPGVEHHSLGHNLLHNWPAYAAYITSFLTIGIIWVNHHAMLGRLREADHSILVLNLLLLMSIGVLPFATALMAEYLRDASYQSLAAGIYSGAFLVMSLLFSAVQRQILIVRPELMRVSLPEEARRRIFRRAVTGLVPYTVATALAPLSAYATVAICAAVAAFYATPLASSTSMRSRSPLDGGDDVV
jgi:uncharacterized membrane protein